MHEGVSDILVARARELDGITRPVTASFAIHVGLLLTLALLPSAWFAGQAPEKLMLISLGAGAVGPDPNGLTALGGKKVDVVAPPPTRPEPILPVSPKSTAMTEPSKALVKPAAPSKATSAPTPQMTPKPSTGAQIAPGNAVAATTATGLGVGLSSGGQGGMSLDTDWCCPDWTNVLRSRINWNEHQGVSGEVVIEFVVEKDGRITNVVARKKSGIPTLDLDAQRAVLSAQLPPLPAAYEPSRLTITLTFPYIR